MENNIECREFQFVLSPTLEPKKIYMEIARIIVDAKIAEISEIDVQNHLLVIMHTKNVVTIEDAVAVYHMLRTANLIVTEFSYDGFQPARFRI
ncbi:MAG: hypothetical protein IJ867_05020 [Clostridia bacterium]|nr:hypothetical protein [Clostridia bacterium]